MSLLNLNNFKDSNADIKPDPQILNAKVGIVHLGFGAFHRAHQALMTDTLIREQGGNWKIVGVSWGSSGIQDLMDPQDNLYSVGIAYNDTLSTHLVGAIHKVLTRHKSEEVFRYMYSEDVKVVSLTVTEKGYCHNPATGHLNLNHPLIAHDLAHLDTPQSVIGFLVNAIKYRKEHNIPPFTPLCCDNLPENGHVLEKVVHDFAKAYDPTLYQWIKDNIQFPCTMVDRIVPRTTERDVEIIESALGVKDKACVMTEPFLQWVIEDKFNNQKPRWDKAGIDNVIFTDDVIPFENMKLRLLNGTHSAIAYLGYLAGYETVATTMQDSDFKTYIRYLMDKEITPSIDVKGVDLGAYKDSLIHRYENKALQHRTWQIAMDGSQKIPQRWLQTIEYGINNQVNVDGLILALAAWIKYTSQVDENNLPIDVLDPLSSKLKSIWEHSTQDQIVSQYLNIQEVFSSHLAVNQTFKTKVETALQLLLKLGAKASIQQFLKSKEL